MSTSLKPPRNLSVKRGVIYKLQSATQTLTQVTKQAILTGVIKADRVKVEERLNICTQCEHFNSTQSTCNLCGCFMKFKSALQAAKCPINKWK